MTNEVEYWRALALYLADCHAATAEDVFDRKGSSKSDRKRMVSICETAEKAIRDGSSNAPLSIYWRGRADGRVLDRLSRAADPRYTVTAQGRAMLKDGGE